jgi:hypothetical protein
MTIVAHVLPPLTGASPYTRAPPPVLLYIVVALELVTTILYNYPFLLPLLLSFYLLVSAFDVLSFFSIESFTFFVISGGPT